MDSPPRFKIGQDRDPISTLPDDLLLGIMERLDLPSAVRAGAVSTRWRHLPHQLSRLHLDVDDFQGTTLLETMDAFMGATRRLLLCECKCDCNNNSSSSRRAAVKTLRLRFYLTAPHLSSIGCAVEDTVGRGETDRFELELIPPSSDLIAGPRKAGWRTELGRQFMAFPHACPLAFRWLTGLTLKSLEFGDSDYLPSLIVACHSLKHLSLRACRIAGHSTLKIDVPNSVITEIEFVRFKCRRIELVSVPKLTRLLCRSWRSNNPPLRFGYVPELHKVDLACLAKTWQTPFALSDCFSMSTRNLSKLSLSFACQMIWIQPQHPKQLIAIFSNLTDVALYCIFPECDLSWTLFILEAAPALQNFILNRTRHFCVKTTEDIAEKTNVVWEPSKDLKHLNLKLLGMVGFEDEDKVTNYIRLVMERAAGLKRITLHSHNCKECNAIDLQSTRTCQADEARKHRIKERLTRGSSSSVKINICECCQGMAVMS